MTSTERDGIPIEDFFYPTPHPLSDILPTNVEYPPAQRQELALRFLADDFSALRVLLFCAVGIPKQG